MEYEHLETVKAMLGITGAYQDNALQGYVSDVIDYMVSAGDSDQTALSERAVGLVTRGVSDLWNHGSGGVSFSPYFRERCIQFCYEPEPEQETVNYRELAEALLKEVQKNGS